MTLVHDQIFVSRSPIPVVAVRDIAVRASLVQEATGCFMSISPVVFGLMRNPLYGAQCILLAAWQLQEVGRYMVITGRCAFGFAPVNWAILRTWRYEGQENDCSGAMLLTSCKRRLTWQTLWPSNQENARRSVVAGDFLLGDFGGRTSLCLLPSHACSLQS
jgi:hypothetical protein